MKQKTITKSILISALKHAFLRLNPWALRQNAVILVTCLCAIASTVSCFFSSPGQLFFELQISIWLWLTVFFSNLAESIAEGRGKAQAESLKESTKSNYAHKKEGDSEIKIPACDLKEDDIIVCRSGDIIPADGEVIDGIASVDESAMTGESAPVIRESGGDRSAVTGGTTVISDEIIIRVTDPPGQGFMQRMIGLIESAVRQKTPNEKALSALLISLTVLFAFVTAAVVVFIFYATQSWATVWSIMPIPVIVGLFVCLTPTTISALLSAIGIAGMDRLIRKNVIAKSGRSVEAAGDINVLMLDKTGTITFGNRMAVAFHAAPGVTELELAKACHLSSISDETAEGRSIMVLAKSQFGLRAPESDPKNLTFLPFSARTRMSGVDVKDEDGSRTIRKGAVDAIKTFVSESKGTFPDEVSRISDRIAAAGGTPLAIAESGKVLGIIELKDVVKGGMKERFSQLRKMGIQTVMITGDNPLTAAAIAAEAGVDDFIAEATPETKLARIKSEQQKGLLVAMTGDGTNDAPALAQSDVGVAMYNGTQAARDAGNMVDMDSNPTKLIEIVETGKQMLMTRGALTTFSIANDVAKYFAILPALFGGLYAGTAAIGPLDALNIMQLHSGESAILSAIIFNALSVVLLIPLALRGVTYKPMGASALLTRNLLIYGGGGLVMPFVGIKLVDMLIVFLRLI